MALISLTCVTPTATRLSGLPVPRADFQKPEVAEGRPAKDGPRLLWWLNPKLAQEWEFRFEIAAPFSTQAAGRWCGGSEVRNIVRNVSYVIPAQAGTYFSNAWA